MFAALLALLEEAKVHFRETLNRFVACVHDPAVRRIIGGDTPMRLYFS